MQSERLIRRMELLEKVTETGRRITRLHSIFNIPELWTHVYASIYNNHGAITGGAVKNDTLDGMSHKRIQKIQESLSDGTYRCKPVRRTYIPKRNGKLRPLGMPSGTDKMVQGACKTILERIYEPVFSDWSHGFRPNRSCHTALEQVKRVWTGVKWFIEFDIKGFFDNLNHEKLVALLEAKIDDAKFIKVIKGMLKAGYIEDWKYHSTFSGTPQGGIISPILSNIYLHELDTFVDDYMKHFECGKRRPPSKEYIKQTSKKSCTIRKMRLYGSTPEREQALKEAETAQRSMSSVDMYSADYRRLRYCRYADDFILGVIGSKEDAVRIMNDVTNYLNQELELEIAPEKTKIVNAKKGVQFLSYHISTWRSDKVTRYKYHGRVAKKRTITEKIFLRVPPEKAHEFIKKNRYGDVDRLKPTRRPEMLNSSDEEIILAYNGQLRGLANYYALAYNVKNKLGKVEFMANHSLFHTLAEKYDCRVSRIMTRLRDNEGYIHRYDVRGEEREIRVYQLKHLNREKVRYTGDVLPDTLHFTVARNELIRRLEANTCEYCGKVTPDCEVHHVRKLKDLTTKKHLTRWQKLMIARRRKTLILCSGTSDSCHELLHQGKLPDNRYKQVI